VCTFNDGEEYMRNWYKNDKLHREGDKPASVRRFADGSKREEWYIDGVLKSKQDTKPKAVIPPADNELKAAREELNTARRDIDTIRAERDEARAKYDALLQKLSAVLG
jgi:hypothetical protein